MGKTPATDFPVSEASVSPAGAVIGQALTVSVTAMTAVSPHGDGAGIENVSATFQDTDIPSMTLHDDGDGADAVAGDGVFAARLPLPIGLPSGTYRIRVELTDTGGLIYPFDLPFDLFPAGDLQIVDDGLTSGWVAEGSRGADMPVPMDFAGETTLAAPGHLDGLNRRRPRANGPRPRLPRADEGADIGTESGDLGADGEVHGDPVGHGWRRQCRD